MLETGAMGIAEPLLGTARELTGRSGITWQRKRKHGGGHLGARRRGLSLILTGTVAAGEDGVKGMDSPKSEDPPNFRYL